MNLFKSLNVLFNQMLKLRKSIRHYRKKLIRRTEDWAIAIYVGNSPWNYAPNKISKNPVLTAQDVTDIPADFVADPFMIYHNECWYMFFEIMNSQTKKGDIGLATSKDGYNWQYQKTILTESFHLSYPYVFQWNNEFYMIPESYQVGEIRLYKAAQFPEEWVYVQPLITHKDYVDSSIIYFNNLWWLFTSSTKSDHLYLYYSNELTGQWTAHPKSPIVANNKKIARPGGRIVVFNDCLIRYAQDDQIIYGNQVHAYIITNITPEIYQEEAIDQNPVLKAGRSGWNEVGMHNIDPHSIDEKQWIACVDGYQVSFVLGGQYKYPNRWLNYILNVLK